MGDGDGGKLEREGLGKGWGHKNCFVEWGMCVVGCSSPCGFCTSHRACLVPNPMFTFAVAAEMRLVIIEGCAAARMVFFCAVSARMCLSACECNMDVDPALVALGHEALTMEDFAIFELMVKYEPIKNQSFCFFWCSYVGQERRKELTVLQGCFRTGHL